VETERRGRAYCMMAMALLAGSWRERPGALIERKPPTLMISGEDDGNQFVYDVEGLF
jgi:hypothetical protein